MIFERLPKDLRKKHGEYWRTRDEDLPGVSQTDGSVVAIAALAARVMYPDKWAARRNLINIFLKSDIGKLSCGVQPTPETSEYGTGQLIHKIGRVIHLTK